MTRVLPESAHEARSRRHFDQVASSWVGRYEAVPSFRARLRIVAEVCGRLLGGGREGRVLDLGSGPGVLGTAVSVWASVVICVDTSWAMLQGGQAAQAEVDAVLDGMGLEHRSAVVVRAAGPASAVSGARAKPFDLALAVSVLEYQADPHAFLAEVVQLLRPGGFLLFTVPNRRSPVRRVERPVDAIAARLGRRTRVARLADRSYSSNRPFGSNVPWADALHDAGAVCREVVPIPLGDSGLRSVLHPNLLVVADRP